MDNKKVIYMDNAATSWPKPAQVHDAVLTAIKEHGGNPGRSGHRMSVSAAKIIQEARELIACLFNISDPTRVIFTLNTTEALNLALKGYLKPGDHVITTSFEHNSILRPLEALRAHGVEITKIPISIESGIAADDIIGAIKDNTKLMVITHASNVTGTINSLENIGKIAADYQFNLLVDAAQTAGVFPVDVKKMNISMLAFAGHKSLFGPQGVGGLYINEGIQLIPLKEGGTGSQSESITQPTILPDRYESGTPNTPGIAGLAAGLKFIMSEGISRIYAHEESLTRYLHNGLLKIPGISVYGPPPEIIKAPVISFNIQGLESSEVAAVLDQSFNIACRSGLHCAPDICRAIGLFKGGTVRFSLGYFNTVEEIDFCLKAVSEIAQ